MTIEKLGNMDFQLKGTIWKTYLDDFVDEFDSRHDNRRIKLRWGDDDIKFYRLCRDLRKNYIAHCLFIWIFLGLELVRVSLVTRQSSMQGWEGSVWGSVRGKFIVNIKMNDFVWNMLQNMFYVCCYILLSRTRPKRRCAPICDAAILLWCNWCRNLTAINYIQYWIVLTLSTLQMGTTLVIIVA